MRKITTKSISNLVKDTIIEINYELDDSLLTLLEKAKLKETSELSKSILDDILENANIAKQGNFIFNLFSIKRSASLR